MLVLVVTGAAQSRKTALHLAAGGGNLPIVDALLHADGIDVNVKSEVRARRDAASGASGGACA